MKKLNAVLTWLIILGLCAHLFLEIPAMFTGHGNFTLHRIISAITLGAMILHIIVVFIIFF